MHDGDIPFTPCTISLIVFAGWQILRYYFSNENHFVILLYMFDGSDIMSGSDANRSVKGFAIP